MDLQLLLLCGSLLSSIVGAHELNLVSNPNTNGSYCPGRITFICNGTNVANGLQWLINGNVNNTFILEPGDTKFPRTVSVTNDITIMVISASPVENSLGINVLSVLSVESLYPILDDAISCRTLSGSSSPFVVRAKDVSSLDYDSVTVIPNYDSEFYLDQLVVTVNLSVSECSDTKYFIDVVLYRDNTTRVANQTIECYEERSCSATFSVSRSNTSLTVVISRLSSYSSESFEGVISNPSERPTLQIVYSNCSVRCESNMRGACELRYHTSSNSVVLETSSTSTNNTILFQPTLEANTVYYYNVTFFIDGRTFKTQGNFTVEGSCSQASSRTGLIVGLVILVVVVAVIIGLVVAVVVAKLIPYKKKHQEIGNHETPVELILAELNLDDLSVDEKGMVVDKEGKNIFESNLTDEHRSVGTTGKDKRLLASEERNAEARKVLEEHNKLKEEKARKALEERNKLEEEKARKALEERNKLEEEKEGAHVYDTTQFLNATSAGQSEADEAVGEDYDRIKTNDDEYDRLHDHNKKKNRQPPQQDGNPVVYSDLNPTEKEDRDRLIDRNNTSITKPKHNKKRSEQHNTKNTFK